MKKLITIIVATMFAAIVIAAPVAGETLQRTPAPTANITNVRR